MPNQTVLRTEASRFAQRQIQRHRRLAPVADLGVRRLDAMKALRFFLLLLMGFLLLVMAGCPGLYDSKRRAIASRHHYDAHSDATRIELEEAKRLDRRDILVYELVMAGIFAGAVNAFIRAGRKVQT